MPKRYRILFWASFAVMLAAVMPIMPTFDAWTTTSAPRPFPLSPAELLPQGEYWRPWDVLYAHLIGTYPCLFPYLNHLFICVVHVVNCFLTYAIARRLGFKNRVAWIAFGYVYICPAMLGVVLDVDSIHQVAAMGWGLLSLYAYLKWEERKVSVLLWLTCVITGTFAKESCFAFMLITPFVAWGLGKVDARRFWRDMAWAVVVGLAYLIARFTLNKDAIASEYLSVSGAQLVKNFGIFILFHLPVFLSMVFDLKRIRERAVVVLSCSVLFASILHLVSVYAVMHTYVSLPFAAVVFAVIVSEMRWRKVVCVIGVLASLVIDVYLTKKTYDSGELGRRLALQAITNTPQPVDSVFTISVADGSRGFSTFIVRDYNAFAWGLFSQYLNDFKWPKTLRDSTVCDYPTADVLADIVDRGRMEGYKVFWVVRDDSVEVVVQ